MKPVIATDVDGILVKWQSGLPYFMAKYNIPTKTVLDIMVNDRFVEAEELFGCNATLAKTLLNEYNNSDFIKYLAPYRDAIAVVNRLKDKYDFVAITALGTTPEAQLNRMFNLNALFPGAFKDVLCVNYGESKIPHYLDIKIKYKERLACFVDDLAYNLEDCHSVMSELPLVWMPRQDYGRKPDCYVNRVHDWNELEKKLLSDDLIIHPAPVPSFSKPVVAEPEQLDVPPAFKAPWMDPQTVLLNETCKEPCTEVLRNYERTHSA